MNNNWIERKHFSLRQDVTTRWNSTFLMFERFVMLKEPLTVMLGRQEYSAHHRALQKIKNQDWIVMQNVVTVLKVRFCYFELKERMLLAIEMAILPDILRDHSPAQPF